MSANIDWQRLVHQNTGLKGRVWRVNMDKPDDWPDQLGGHQWACQGCGMVNDPWHLSCRYCQTLKWGVVP